MLRSSLLRLPPVYGDRTCRGDSRSEADDLAAATTAAGAIGGGAVQRAATVAVVRAAADLAVEGADAPVEDEPLQQKRVLCRRDVHRFAVGFSRRRSILLPVGNVGDLVVNI